MAVCFSTGWPSASLTAIPSTGRTSPAPPRASPPSLSSPRTPLPSLTCALQCPHFQSCSGCTQEYNLDRPVILDEVTEFFKKHGVSDFSFDSCRLWGWRCRAKLAGRGSSTSPLTGLYEEGSHNVFDIADCKAPHPNINAAVELLKRGIIELNIEPYDEDQGTAELRYVQMAVTAYNTSLPSSERYRNAGCTNSWLETMDLAYNALSGSLPNSLGYLKNLRDLQLRGNMFRGSVPNCIGNLSSLESL